MHSEPAHDTGDYVFTREVFTAKRERKNAQEPLFFAMQTMTTFPVP
jgi:hypothetical protein